MYTSNQIFTLGVFAGILLITAGILVVVIYDRIRANSFNAHTNQMLNLVGEYGPTPQDENLGYLMHLTEQENERLQAEIADLKDGLDEADAAFNELLADNAELKAAVKHLKSKLLSYASEFNEVVQTRAALSEQAKRQNTRIAQLEEELRLTKVTPEHGEQDPFYSPVVLTKNDGLYED